VEKRRDRRPVTRAGPSDARTRPVAKNQPGRVEIVGCWKRRRSCVHGAEVGSTTCATLARASGGILEVGASSRRKHTDPKHMTNVQIPPRLRVLVVDDEALIRWALVETLVDAGHEALDAGDVKTAIHAVLTAPRPFDVILLDLRLPDASGLVVLSQVRCCSPRTKVILMTAYGTPDVVEDAFDLGAFRVLPKPVDMSELSNLVLEAHAASHIRSELR
jgi:CheY-like chemotaxis protein